MAKSFINRYFTLILICWTFFIFGVLAYEIREHWFGLLGTLEKTADIVFERDLLMRRWNDSHGGVYVPVTDKARPNPCLSDVSDRDETTTTGKKLTLVNPAFMMRQLYELDGESSGMISHFTSLKPLRPGNRPDPWEAEALREFEQGRSRVSAVAVIGGQKYFRVMMPLTTEKGCLKCHAAQGYRERDVRGGISVSIPFEPFLAGNRKNNISDIFGYGFLWVLGFGVLFFGKRTLERNTRALVESEERFSAAFRHAPLLMTISSIDDGAFLEVNDEFVRKSGFTREEAVGKSSLALGCITAPNRQRILGELEKRGHIANMEVEFMTRSRAVIRCLFFCERITINGKQKLLSIIQDINERKQTEDALQASEAKYRSMILNSPDLTIVQGIDGRVLYLSPQAEKVIGHPPDAFLGQRFPEFIHPEDREKASEAMRNVLSGGDVVNFEYRFFGNDGSLHWLSHTAIPIYHQGNIHSIQSSVRNITERKQAEETLRESHTLLRNAVASAPIILYTVDTNGVFKPSTGFGLHRIGIQPGEIAGVSHFDLYKNYPEANERLRRALSGESENFTIEAQGTVWDVHYAPLRGPENVIQGVVGVAIDITERKKTEQELLRAKEFNENLIATANVIIVGLDARGNTTLFNKTAEKITGYTAQELAGRSWFDVLIPGDLYPQAGAAPGRQVHGGLPRNFENPILTKSGRERFISWQNNEIIHQGEFAGSISFGVDITEQKMLQEQLFHAQKMESVGTLAGGVAHDFNNILTIISGNVALMKMETPHAELLPYLQQIEEASSRAAALTQGLLAFSRKQAISPKPADINVVLRNIRRMLARLIGEDIDLAVELSPQPLPVMVDIGQMDQVFINLVVNARDAMPDGGIIRITTQPRQVDFDFARTHEIATGFHAEIVVADTGCGMDSATRERIFEPFFTTKEVGKGTGLGLAIVYGAVKQHHGAVIVQSGPRVGSAFTIYLPLVGAAETAAIPAESPASPGGSGTILLAEDEAAVRKITFKLLEACGYAVFTAVDGKDAVDLFRDHADAIDLVILDVVMPNMNGKQAYDQIKRIRPEAKIIFTSGYPDDILSLKGMHDENLTVIQKPFTPAMLFKTVDEEMNRV